MDTFEDYLERACQNYEGMPILDVFTSGHIVRAAREGRKKLNDKLRIHDLTATDYWVMMFLANGAEQVSPSVLCELVDVSRTKMTRVITDLESKGYVSRTPNKDDRRSLYLSITESGRAKLEALAPTVASVYSIMWYPATDDDKRQVIEILSKITL